MKVVNLNGQNHLVENAEDSTLLKAFGLNAPTVSLKTALEYLKAENIGTLQDITFGNAVFTVRNLTPVEEGYLTVANSIMEEAELTAMAVLVNKQVDVLAGKL